MALDFQPVSIDLTNGQNSKRDDKLVIPTKLLSCSNYVFTDGGILTRRNGHTRLCAAVDTSGNALTLADLLTSYRGEIIMGARDAVYSYSPAKSAQAPRGKASSVSARKYPVIRNMASQSNPDWTTDPATGVSFYAWEDSRGGVRYSVIDEETGTPLVWDTELSGTAVVPRVLLTNLYVRIFYIEGANLKSANIDRQAPMVIASTTTHRTDVHGTQKVFDAAVQPGTDQVHVAYQSTTPELVRVACAVASTGTPVVDSLANNINSIAVVRTTDARFTTVYSQVAVGLRAVSDTSVLAVTTNVAGPTTIDGDATAMATNVLTACETTANSIEAFYLSASGPPDTLIRSAGTTSGSAVVGAAEFLHHCHLAGAVFRHNSVTYAPVVFDSSTQPTVFLVSTADRRVVAKALALSAAIPTESFARLGSVASPVSGVYGLPVLEQGRLAIQDGNTTTTVGVARVDFGMDRTDVLMPTQYADTLVLPSASPSAYDGVSAPELGFHVYPEAFTSTDDGAGNVDVGVHQFVCVYEWTDAQGRRHQSAPSLAQSHTVASSAKKIDFEFQTLSLTEKYDNSGASLKAVPRTNVDVVLYGTIASGTTTFYRIGSVENDPINATVAYEHNSSDAAIQSNEVLYTVGGALESFSPPAARVAWGHQSRVFLAGCEDSRSVRYSQQLSPGTGPEFHPDLELRLPEEAGEPTAGISYAGRCLIFTADRIAFTYGEGPDALGNGAGYFPIDWLPHDVGCTDARSLVESPDGLWFKTRRGLRKLNPDLSLGRNEDGAEAGSEMDDYAAQDVTGVVLTPTKQRIVWTTSSGVALCWDYFWRQWSQFSGLTAAGAALWGSTFVRVSSAGVLFQEGTGFQDENASAVGVNVNGSWETAWIRLGGTQGLQRVRMLTLLGNMTNGASDDIAVTLSHNFETTDQYLLTFDGRTTGATRIRVKPAIQKCEALKVYVESSGSTGQGVRWANLSLEIGQKRGTFKTAATAQT